ncbi:hypothetical protein TIFTF001_012576 [Ficus carica]|uniref:Uncharacterized protein n=1 Tax=Ficus carica TaxID=3494 RepID=A0AA88A0K1_FICCA|nr:hypothetical protein TIFTF001_012576 [Ficus carica]
MSSCRDPYCHPYVRGLLQLVQLASRECATRGTVSYVGRSNTRITSRFMVLCLVSHNVGPGWDKLNPDDPEEEECLRVAMYFRCSSVTGMI